MAFPDAQPFVDSNSRTLIPVRFVSEAHGATKSYDTGAKNAGKDYKMRKYYVDYYRDFANTYTLYYVETKEDEAVIAGMSGAERISRKEAERLCARENSRRKYEQSSSGYASNAIYPAADVRETSFENSCRHEKRGYIWERK